MKIKIKKKTLLTAIEIVEKALPSKTVIDSLKGIKISTDKENIYFTASKQDLAINFMINKDFEILEHGTIILPGNYLIAIIKKTQEEDITITEENNSCLLETAKSKINLIEYDISSYPDIKFDLDDNKPFKISTKILEKCYNQTKNAVAINNVKPILTGINFNFVESQLIVGSTDARRLSISNFDAPKTNPDIKFTISKILLSDIIKILEIAKIEEIEIYNFANQFILKADTLILKARLLEGEYPDIKRLIPDKSNYSFEINKNYLLLILEKINLLSERDNGNATIYIEDNNLKIKSYFKELGGIEEICEIQNLNGSPFPISFDPKFLIDAIISIEKENLKIELVDEISAFSINGIDDKNNIQVISPIRMA